MKKIAMFLAGVFAACAVQADFADGKFTSASVGTGSYLYSTSIGWFSHVGSQWDFSGNTADQIKTGTGNLGIGQVIAGTGLTDGMTFRFDMAWTADAAGSAERIRIALVGINDANGDFRLNLSALGTASPGVTVEYADSVTALYYDASTWNNLLTASSPMTTYTFENINAAGFDYVAVVFMTINMEGGAGDVFTLDNVSLSGDPAPAHGTAVIIR